MSNPSNDDLARALAGLSSGEHHEPDEDHPEEHRAEHGDEHGHPSGVDPRSGGPAAPTPTTPGSAPRPQAPRQAAPPPAPRQAAPQQAAPRQAAPQQTAARQAAPRQAAPGHAAQRSAAPAGTPRAATPAAGAPQSPRPAVPTPARPAAPGQRSPATQRPATPGTAPAGRPAAPSVPTQRINRPVTPGNIPPRAPQRPGQPPAAGSSAAATRPAQPATTPGVARPAAPATARPASPNPQHDYSRQPQAEEKSPGAEGVAVHLKGNTAGYQGDDHAASGLETVVADDADEVNVPPPPMEYLGHTHHMPPSDAPVVMPKYQSMNYKQTLIPILLTTGLCMIALGACNIILNEDTPLGSLPTAVAIVLFVAGAISLIFGVTTMLQVKSVLDEQARATAPAAESGV